MNQIIPIKCATAAEPFPFSRIIYKYPYEGSALYAFGFAAIKTDNCEYILVDSGLPSDEEMKLAEPAIKEQFGIAVDNVPFEECLKQHAIKPEAIKIVIQTHFHWDHAWNLNKLPNARIYVQKKEITSAVAPMPYERIHYGYWGGIYKVPGFLQCTDRIVPIDGESEIVPGIRVIPTPGHTAGSQTVMVDTKDGCYAMVGDFANIPLAIEGDGWPAGLITSAEDWYRSLNRLRKENYIKALTFHDVETYKQIYG